MDVVEWLEQIAKLDELIHTKEDKIQKLLASATKMTASLDGMPHGSGISDKVGENAIKIADLSQEKEALKQQREHIIKTMQMLPLNEFKVLHREYVLCMSRKEIAADLNYTRVQVWRIKQKALERLKDVTKCNQM